MIGLCNLGMIWQRLRDRFVEFWNGLAEVALLIARRSYRGALSSTLNYIISVFKLSYITLSNNIVFIVQKGGYSRAFVHLCPKQKHLFVRKGSQLALASTRP